MHMEKSPPLMIGTLDHQVVVFFSFIRRLNVIIFTTMSFKVLLTQKLDNKLQQLISPKQKNQLGRYISNFIGNGTLIDTSFPNKIYVGYLSRNLIDTY